MARDSLRATLDDLKADEASADRPYLESMLRRLGYSEKEIRAELGPAVEADTPATPAPARDDSQPPTREYRLVVPARESAFWVGDGAPVPRDDSPFESLERVNFEDVGDVEFVPEEPTEFEEIQPESSDFEVVEEEAPTLAADEAGEFQEAAIQEFPVDAPAESLPDAPLDTFGNADVDTQSPTRVRIKRVRARSKEEAEAKVSSKSRRVIKSIPVDIVERWGPGGKA